MTEKQAAQNRYTRITAHSGADQTIDNSLESIAYALHSGADAFEVDVRRNAAGALALGHDFADEKAPLLSAVFLMLQQSPQAQNMKINCDLKEAQLELEVLELAQTFALQERLIYSGDVDAQLFLSHAEQLRPVELFINLEALLPEFSQNMESAFEQAGSQHYFTLDHSHEIMQLAALAEKYPYRALNMYHGFWNEAVAARAASTDLRFSLWTVDDEAILRRLLVKGVYAITTNNLSVALRLREELQR